MANFGDTERHIKGLFCKGRRFSYDGHDYEVLECGKPVPPKGECKTDVYVLAQEINGGEKEFKISVKKSNADFLENKIALERAIQIFGEDTQTILRKSLDKIKECFENDPLVYFKKYKRTRAFCIKMGWKFELTNKRGGEKCGKLLLSPEQKIDIYSGINLGKDKKDCQVNGKCIKDSGVANYIITVDGCGKPLDDYLRNMVPIENFAPKQDIYFVCKALNYRVSEGKWDGDRPLAVYVGWALKDGKLYGELVYDSPLAHRGGEIGRNLQGILQQLGIDKDNFPDLKAKLDSSVKCIDVDK